MPESEPKPRESKPQKAGKRLGAADRTAWRRPAGVALGTWRYVHEGAIASRYNAFVAGTPLCQLDLELLAEVFPSADQTPVTPDPRESPVARNQLQRELCEGDRSEKKNDHGRKWLLDLGCGTGRASELLAAAGYGVLAVDLSIPMLDQVRERNLGSVIPIQANLVELDCLAANVADGAVCLFSTLGMIQGRSNRRRFLAHVRRIVRPASPFYLHLHHRYAALTNLPGLRQLTISAVRSVMRPDWEFGDAVYAYRGLPDMFLHQFSRRELLADFAATGWRVQRWERLSLDGAKLLDRGERSVAGGFLVVVH